MAGVMMPLIFLMENLMRRGPEHLFYCWIARLDHLLWSKTKKKRLKAEITTTLTNVNAIARSCEDKKIAKKLYLVQTVD